MAIMVVEMAAIVAHDEEEPGIAGHQSDPHRGQRIAEIDRVAGEAIGAACHQVDAAAMGQAGWWCSFQQGFRRPDVEEDGERDHRDAGDPAPLFA